MVENDGILGDHDRQSTVRRLGCGCSKRESVSVGRRKRRDRETGLAIGALRTGEIAREDLVSFVIKRRRENGVAFYFEKIVEMVHQFY